MTAGLGIATPPASSGRPKLWADRAILLMLGFGFASGLPLPLSGFTLRQWLSEGHASLGLIGLTASIGLAYTLKFAWSPLLDRAPARFGRRRFWLLLIQPTLIAAMIALALAVSHHRIAAAIALAALIAFLSASQDIVIDAWRIETFPRQRQGYALAAYVWGYRMALLLSGAGAIALATPLGWPRALLAVASLGLLAPFVTLLAPEPATTARLAHGWQVFVAPVREFVARPGAAALIAFVALFYLGEALAGTMLPPFYRSLGFDRAAVALANGPASLAATIAGVAAGGWLVARIGFGRALILTGFGQMAAMAMYIVLAQSAGNHTVLIATAIIEAFSEGLASVAFLSFLSSLCAPAYTASQYALLSSLAPLAMRTLAGGAGFLAHATGWTTFYALAMAASLPAMLTMLLIIRRFPSIVQNKGQGSAPMRERGDPPRAEPLEPNC